MSNSRCNALAQTFFTTLYSLGSLPILMDDDQLSVHAVYGTVYVGLTCLMLYYTFKKGPSKNNSDADDQALFLSAASQFKKPQRATVLTLLFLADISLIIVNAIKHHSFDGSFVALCVGTALHLASTVLNDERICKSGIWKTVCRNEQADIEAQLLRDPVANGSSSSHHSESASSRS